MLLSATYTVAFSDLNGGKPALFFHESLLERPNEFFV